jgi:hypothetical protein
VVTVDVIPFCFVRVMESGLWEWWYCFLSTTELSDEFLEEDMPTYDAMSCIGLNEG